MSRAGKTAAASFQADRSADAPRFPAAAQEPRVSNEQDKATPRRAPGAPSDSRAPGPVALSIDVEDWFHSENVKAACPRQSWGTLPSRVEKTTLRLLEILADKDVRATFFVLGWVAQRCPALVREIAAQGHELASHGFGHELVYRLTPESFRDDVIRSKLLLEDLGGVPVRGYRAPCFSITDWAIPILRAAGYAYDSSAVPSLTHDRYGRLSGVDRRSPILELAEGFHEVSVPCLPLRRLGFPWGGGGYFRLVPLPVWRQGMRLIRRGGQPYVFYIHPWEIDPDHPIPSSVTPLNRFRQTIGLSRCEQRFSRLVADFDWITVGRLLDGFIRSRSDYSRSSDMVYR